MSVAVILEHLHSHLVECLQRNIFIWIQIGPFLFLQRGLGNDPSWPRSLAHKAMWEIFCATLLGEEHIMKCVTTANSWCIPCPASHELEAILLMQRITYLKVPSLQIGVFGNVSHVYLWMWDVRRAHLRRCMGVRERRWACQNETT